MDLCWCCGCSGNVDQMSHLGQHPEVAVCTKHGRYKRSDRLHRALRCPRPPGPAQTNDPLPPCRPSWGSAFGAVAERCRLRGGVW